MRRNGLRTALAANRAETFWTFPINFYGFNREGTPLSEAIRQNWWRQAMMGAANAHYECIKAFSETDFTADLKSIKVPTLVMHGEDDQIVPVHDSARKSARLIKGAAEIYYPGLPHGLTATHPDLINRDLLTFIQEGKRKVA